MWKKFKSIEKYLPIWYFPVCFYVSFWITIVACAPGNSNLASYNCHKSYSNNASLYTSFVLQEELKGDHAVYMRRHPELQAMLGDFMQFLLLRKPDDAVAFAAEYFASFSSKMPGQSPYLQSSTPSPHANTRASPKIKHLAQSQWWPNVLAARVCSTAHEFHETYSVTFIVLCQFTPKMKANAVPRLLSTLVWIDQYNECNGMTSPW